MQSRYEEECFTQGPNLPVVYFKPLVQVFISDVSPWVLQFLRFKCGWGVPVS